MRIEIKKTDDDTVARLCVGLVTLALGLPYRDVFNHANRGGDTVMIRQLALYLLYNVCDMSQSRLGATFSRDRTTVRYACNAIEDQRDYDVFDRMIERLENDLRAIVTLPQSLAEGTI